MTAQDAFKAMNSRYRALEKAGICTPAAQSVTVFHDRLLRLAKRCEEDRPAFEALAASGLFDIENMNMLVNAANGLAHVEGCWVAYGGPGKYPRLAEKHNRIQELLGIQLMDLEFVARRFRPEGLAETVASVQRGSHGNDAAEELLRICQVGQQYLKELRNVGHDPSVDAETERLYDELMDSPSLIDSGTAVLKEMRDRAYTVALAMSEEVEAAARYIFRNDPKRLAGYVDVMK